ncbi:MAG: DUF2339 domain-containing protein [Bacteriovorax sp.]|jgi:uncharacterized membrane protein
MTEQDQTIQDRLVNLEKKIDHITKVLGLRYPTAQVSQSQSEEEFPPPVPKNEAPRVASYRASNTSPSTPINLLPILAVICFGLAGIFIVKLAIESGWLTPERQWGLLALFGIALVGVGLLISNIEKAYRSYAGAAGVIVLYLASYSSSLYFDIFPPTVAQALAAFVSLFCLYLFHYYETELFVVICAIGTYISPVILGKESDIIFLSGFFLIWAALFSRISIYLRSRTLVLLSSYLGLGIFTFLNITAANPEDLRNVILVQSMQFIIYAGGVFYYSVKNKDPLSKTEALAYLPILLFFYGTIYYFLNKYNPTLAPWISLGFSGFIYFLYWQAKKFIQNLESQSLVQSFFAVVLFHSGYMELLPAEGKSWLLPLFILGKYVSDQKNDFKSLAPPLKFAFFAMSAIEFFNLCFRLMGEMNLQNVVPALATIALGFFYYTKSFKNIKDTQGLFLGLLHILCILALYRLAYDYGSLAVSAAWGLYSVAILILGYINKNAVLAKSSLLVLTVTCLKALVYDAAQTSSGIRIASLILTGAILYGAGFMFQKIKKWEV